MRFNNNLYLPKDLLSGAYKRPRLFLCEVDKARMCELEAVSMSGTFKFNAYSELSFTVGRTYTNMITGQTDVNPFYDHIQALRIVELEGFGFFEIQDPEIVSDGLREVKNVTAYSLEYTLSQKYLENLYVNTGEIEDIGVNSDGTVTTITLYNPTNKSASLLHIILEKIYGWTIGHVDTSLQTMSRTFEVSRASVYDFIVQDICEKFNCFTVFDTINNTINLYAEASISKFRGDGTTTSFIISPPYKDLGSVTIDSYKTTEWEYNYETGALTFSSAPDKGSLIEVTDNSQEEWMTDVYVTFNNLAQEINISYSADDIKTVLTVKGGEDLDIAEVNMGLPYLVDISYYYSPDWMGQELYDAYTDYLKKCNESQTIYQDNAQKILEINNRVLYEQNRMTLQYIPASIITLNTVGTYYVKGGTAPNYYYVEVKLPDEYSAKTASKGLYHTKSDKALSEANFESFYEALRYYFNPDENDISKLEAIQDDFDYVTTYSIKDYLIPELKNATTDDQKNTAISNFLDELWNQLGLIPLQTLYVRPYEKIKETQEEAGFNSESSENYWQYKIVQLILDSLSKAVSKREATIESYDEEMASLTQENGEIASGTLIYNNFTDKQLVRLSAFLREDEYTDDNIFITDSDSIDTIMDTKKELMECGRIELQKLCEPKLEFSMDMANIYAIPEFEPIVSQFNLGNLIRVELRSDYIKRARLLAVDINFDDFSDFSCEFGELTSLRTPASIHADLLANALSAGKSVASNASYWNDGVDKVTNIELQIQQGLLNAVQAIKAQDGTQYITTDKYGIRLQKVDPATGAIYPQEAWLTNNQILYSDDNFQTAKTALGEFTYDGNTYYGVLADAVIAGYVVGSTMEGGTIKIGKQSDGSYAFEVREDGSVVMNGGSSIDGYVKEQDFNSVKDSLTIVSDTEPTNASDGQLWLNTANNPYSLMVYTNGEWVYFSQQEGQKVYTSKPSTYNEGDLWILADGEFYPESDPVYSAGCILKANEDLEWVDAAPDITNTISNVKQYFEFNQDTGLKIGQKDEKFYVNIDSTEMGFYDNSNGQNEKVVSISNNSATIQNATFEGSNGTTFDNNAQFNKQVSFGSFIWKTESNGSLSLAIET